MTRIVAIGADPIHDAGRRVGPRLDAAVTLLDRRFGDEFGGWRGFEIAFDIGFERGLIAFESEEIIGAMGDDFVGDFDLTAHRVDGDERAFELLGFGELIEQLGNGGDFIAFLGNRQLRQGQAGVGGVSAERMQGLQALALVVGAARGLAVNGDEVVAIGPERRDPALEAPPEKNWINAVDEVAQPALAGNAEMEVAEAAQKGEMALTPGDDLVKIIARTYCCAAQQQQDLGERIHHAPRLALVGKLGKMLEQQGQPVPRNLLVQGNESGLTR